MTRYQKLTIFALIAVSIFFISLIANAWTSDSVPVFQAIRFATTTKAWPEGAEVVTPYPPAYVPTASFCVAATATSAQYTMTTTGGDIFQICGGGGLASYAFINCAADPTATTTAGTGFNIPPVMDGQCIPAREITSAKCAVLGGAAVGGSAAAGGAVCFMQLTSPGGSHKGT
jgi:hypothetical protein